jgi:polyketide biosynthesis 3-hydroxy-3-methylglutaryl-CoA synthase-like enzyme PksG
MYEHREHIMVGIEAINVYGCRAMIDVKQMAIDKGFYNKRFDNLLMEKKSVNMPWEDAVTCAANAAKPIIDKLSPEDRSKINLLITATESGVDLGKSLSPYVFQLLGLSAACRLFEIKQACYGGTAALQMAASYILSNVSPGAKALVICTDVAQKSPENMAEGEISQGAGAVALLVSSVPRVLQIEPGAFGLFGQEIQDACRPEPGLETADSELSLMSYLTSAENAFLNYKSKIPDADFRDSFAFLAMHTPFGGMVKGTHRSLMRKFKSLPPPEIEADFEKRLAPALKYCKQMGNLYSGSVYLSLCGLIDSIELQPEKIRVGIFSYGSGSSAEFYSGMIDSQANTALRPMQIQKHLDDRLLVDTEKFDFISKLNFGCRLGVKDNNIDKGPLEEIYERKFAGMGIAVLDRIENYHRHYKWV